MKKLWISFFLYLVVSGLQAQNIENILFKAGYENVYVREEGDTVKVYFEHREFRNPFHSLRYASLLLPELAEKTVVWIPMYHNVPIGKYTDDGYKYEAINSKDKTYFNKVNKVFKEYRFHFRLQPNVLARFGYYSNPFETKVHLILDSHIYVARGLSVQTGLSIPIQNSLDSQQDKLSLAPNMLHYFTQPVQEHFLALSAGTFYNNRYGLDVQYRHAPLDSRWSYGLESGLTGYYWQNGGDFYSEKLNNFHAVADVEYRFAFDNVSAKLSAGQFLYNDLGARVDIIRQFSTAEVGLFASGTQEGLTGGFQFAFSLFPGKLYRNRNVELRTTEEFRWEYTYNNDFPVARKYRIGMPRLSDILRQYNADFGN